MIRPINTKRETWETGRDLEAELLTGIGHVQSGQYQELTSVRVPYPTAVRLKPTGAALTLLRIVESAPEAVKAILAQGNDTASHYAA